MTYPNTNLSQDLPDQDFGGQPASAWGVPAFQWVNSVLTFLGTSYLTYNRQPWTTEVFKANTALSLGDAVAIDAGIPGGPYVGRYSSSMTSPVFLGIALEAVSMGARVRVATGGVLPGTTTGLVGTGSHQTAGVNPLTGRVRTFTGGDVAIGQIDPAGNLVLGAAAAGGTLAGDVTGSLGSNVITGMQGPTVVWGTGDGTGTLTDLHFRGPGAVGSDLNGSNLFLDASLGTGNTGVTGAIVFTYGTYTGSFMFPVATQAHTRLEVMRVQQGLSLNTTVDPGLGNVMLAGSGAVYGWDGAAKWSGLQWNGSNAWLVGDPGLPTLQLQGTQIKIPSSTVYLGVGAFNIAAQLQIDSTTTGVLIPRMSTTQRDAISTPPDGLLIYNTTTHRLNSYDSGGGAWHAYS